MTSQFGDSLQIFREDWSGSIAADEVDFHRLAVLLGVDESRWYLVRVLIAVLGSTQMVEGYAVPIKDGIYPNLAEQANRGEVIRLTRIVDVEWTDDTNLQLPTRVPVKSATEFLKHGFKRMVLILTRGELSSLPGTKFEMVSAQ